ncbi:methyltransferase domain-containing protein [Nonomuraea sp. NPDC050556]|uniref:methyltransferase domain-containing protein n=1 Tax=Nonomuraea sp. NPDC050556 TaxID=3364369 RepID=UPI0037A7EEBD
MRETTELIELLDAADLVPAAVTLRARTYDLLALAPGATVADVGCGAGRAVTELAGRGLKAVGVDLSEQMIGVARERWPELDFRLGDAFHLPFEDGELAGYRADKVLHDLPDTGRAVKEARRVLAPGGRIVLAGQDWDGFVIEAEDAELTRTIVRTRAAQVPSPRAARGHRNLLLEAGFQDVTAEAHTGIFTGTGMLPLLTGLASAALAAGAITREQHDAWTAEQRERASADLMFLAVPIFVAAGTAPGLQP